MFSELEEAGERAEQAERLRRTTVHPHVTNKNPKHRDVKGPFLDPKPESGEPGLEHRPSEPRWVRNFWLDPWEVEHRVLSPSSACFYTLFEKLW